MLSDSERKLIRILYNLQLSPSKLPLLKALTIKTGKAVSVIISNLPKLHDTGYIVLETTPHISSQIIRAWEDQPTPTISRDTYIGRY